MSQKASTKKLPRNLELCQTSDSSKYALLDSGQERRIEQFGEAIIIRPYKRAIWNLHRPLAEWRKVAWAEYQPPAGWQALKRDLPDSWVCSTDVGAFKVRLQKSSQVGLFPEHLQYLQDLQPQLNQQAQVLNLFAYTGAATIFALNSGAQVTHVDLSRTCLNWAHENLTLNQLSQSTCRLIPEDALTYLKTQTKKQSSFDLIIADPPAFSRPRKNQQWQIEGIIKELINLCCAVLAPRGMLCLSSHQLELDQHTLKNLVSQNTHSLSFQFVTKALTLQEKHRDISLPAGGVVLCYRTS